ncbi:M14 family zinc carboxypeptidase [Streptomyces sp. NPDC057611]|uniref:M14 family zinc carboxypeptidase n=1 Tax=Streptomyces sp. NPDC057611 TaxID=3346182 RepID=UPI00367F2960
MTAGLVLGLTAGFGAALAGPAQASSVHTAVAAADTSTMPSGRTTFRTINDYNAEMVDLAAANPNLVKHITLPHKTRMGKSVFGIEVTDDVNANDGKPVMFMTGMHHGNEWASGEHTIEFAYDLINHFNSADPEITALLHKVRVIFVPVVNVDGFMRNRRTGCGVSPDCALAGGVDVNRNYPFGWGANIASDFTNRGPAAGSEPEIQNVMDIVKSHQVTTFITNHTSGHTVLRAPFQKAAGDAPDEPAYKALTDAITAKNGYTGMQSGYDYETTGEANDWSYYASRGFGFTFEIMTPTTKDTYARVIDDYNGTGVFDGHSNREGFMVVLRHTAEASAHSQITGDARPGNVLTISKSFDLWTSPIKNIDGTTSAPQAVPTHLQSTMTVPVGGHFTWNVNPSVRPQPGYTSVGVVATGPGKFIRERWTLTCSSPDGTVLDSVPVTVDMGQVADVNLPNCKKSNKNAAKVDAKVISKKVIAGETQAQVDVQVTAKGVQPSGQVVATVDGLTVGTATVVNGHAVLTLAPFDQPGVTKVDISYSGDANVAGGDTTVSINVRG